MHTQQRRRFVCNAGHDAMNAMRANANAERRRSRHAAHSESAEIGVAGRALVPSLRDSNRQRTINSGGERDEDARSIRKWGKGGATGFCSLHSVSLLCPFRSHSKFALGSASEKRGKGGWLQSLRIPFRSSV